MSPSSRYRVIIIIILDHTEDVIIVIIIIRDISIILIGRWKGPLVALMGGRPTTSTLSSTIWGFAGFSVTKKLSPLTLGSLWWQVWDRLKIIFFGLIWLAFDFWWHLMTFVGIWWLLMAFDDFCWHLMTFVGIWWLLLAFDDFWWHLMTCHPTGGSWKICWRKTRFLFQFQIVSSPWFRCFRISILSIPICVDRHLI